MDQYHPGKMLDQDKNTYWATDDDIIKSSVEIDLGKAVQFDLIVLSEFIELGQRVTSFTVEAIHDDHWHTIAEGTTIGYKRILKVQKIKTNKLRLNILDAKSCPLISSFELFEEAAINLQH